MMKATLICYAWSAASLFATSLGDSRVHAIQPEVVAFTFTSVVSAATPATLAFNNIGE